MAATWMVGLQLLRFLHIAAGKINMSKILYFFLGCYLP